MIKNVIIPFIEAKDYRYGNIHAFGIMNIKWVLKGAVLRKPKVLKAARMASIFLKHGVPFQYDPITRIPERVNLMKFECVDQRFGLEYKPKRDDYRWVVNRKKEARMVKIRTRA